MTWVGRQCSFALLVAFAACCAAAIVGCSKSDALAQARDRGDRSSVQREVEALFPDIRTISPAQLAEQLSHPEPPLLLDVRSDEEFAVSHIPGARRVDLEGDPAAQLPDVECTRPIVVYCSVGYRSARFAQALTRSGYLNVANLEGSIFSWAIDGRPLENASGATRLVHPYNKQWATLLPADLRG